jgi:hypothetical protein
MLILKKNYLNQRKVFLEAKYEESFEKYFENILYLEMESSLILGRHVLKLPLYYYYYYYY